eukprot:g4052.t1
MSESESDDEDYGQFFARFTTNSDAETGRKRYLAFIHHHHLTPITAFLKDVDNEACVLSEASLSPKDGTAIAECLKENTKIRILDLSLTGIGPTGCFSIARGLLLNSTVTELNFDSCNCDRQAAAALAQLVHLQSLSLNHNRGAGEAFVHALVQEERLSNLHTLKLSRTEFHRPGVLKLLHLFDHARLDQLAHLDLSWNRLGNHGGARMLIDGLAVWVVGHELGLEILHLDHNGIVDADVVPEEGPECDTSGIVLLLKGASRLRLLGLEHNKLTSISAFALANGLCVNKGLWTLAVGHNPIGFDGAVALMDAMADTTHNQSLCLLRIERALMEVEDTQKQASGEEDLFLMLKERAAVTVQKVLTARRAMADSHEDELGEVEIRKIFESGIKTMFKRAKKNPRMPRVEYGQPEWTALLSALYHDVRVAAQEKNMLGKAGQLDHALFQLATRANDRSFVAGVSFSSFHDEIMHPAVLISGKDDGVTMH